MAAAATATKATKATKAKTTTTKKASTTKSKKVTAAEKAKAESGHPSWKDIIKVCCSAGYVSFTH